VLGLANGATTTTLKTSKERQRREKNIDREETKLALALA
jgi:hypothetical protein